MRAETIGRRQDGSRIDGVNSGDRIVARATLLAFLRFRKGFDSLAILNYQFGWLRGLQKLLKGRNFLVAGGIFWLRGTDLNGRLSGYELSQGREKRTIPQARGLNREFRSIRHYLVGCDWRLAGTDE